MIRLLKWLIWGDAHLHQWGVYNQIKWHDLATNDVIEHEYVMRCKYFGNMKSFKA